MAFLYLLNSSSSRQNILQYILSVPSVNFKVMILKLDFDDSNTSIPKTFAFTVTLSISKVIKLIGVGSSVISFPMINGLSFFTSTLGITLAFAFSISSLNSWAFSSLILVIIFILNPASFKSFSRGFLILLNFISSALLVSSMIRLSSSIFKGIFMNMSNNGASLL